ncbi:MAG: sulfite exporter TauE/SafE family protein, partial [Candidatus Acidiferrales bacterium]
PHWLEARRLMDVLIGFVIAVVVGLTGIGGGSFTVPALILIMGLPAAAAVGTAFVFAGALRLIAAPFYMFGKHWHGRYLWLMVQGAVPGLLIGTFLLRMLGTQALSPIATIIIGLLLVSSSSVTFAKRIQNPQFVQKNSKWLPWLALPIGVEAGFSSAGAGALGTVLLLNYSEMSPTDVVGTDLLFGLVLAVIGSAIHWRWGSVGGAVLLRLLAGGVPGVLAGCALARMVPARRLKFAVAALAIFAGLQLVWSGSKTYVEKQASRSAKIVVPATVAARLGH